MTFIVRSIAVTADGREIVRSNPFNQPEIGIGRNGENAIHLPDLGVDPFHATVRQLDGDRIEVESKQGLKFQVDGRDAHKTIIEPATGAELRFGGHAVTIAKDGEDISFTVKRVDAISDAEEEREIGSLYTLKGLLPGKRMGAWTFALLALAAFLAWPIFTWATWQGVDERPDNQFFADTMWSSGKLSLAHQSLENDCTACHDNAFVSVRDNACLDCHTDDAHDHAAQPRLIAARGEPTGFAAVKRYVAASFNKPAGRCVECHSEHEGAGPMQPTAQAFCADCHDGMDARLTDTELENASDFTSAHPQFRPAVLLTPKGDTPPTKRISLDQKPTEYNGLKFPHRLHLSRTGGVAQMGRRLSGKFGFGAQMECSDCHTPTPDGVRFEPVDMEENCAMCHSLAFDKVGGTVRTLRHGQPEQVAADLRAYFRGTGPKQPNLGGMRRRPGAYAGQRAASDYAREVRFRPNRAEAAIAQVFSKGGACFDCHGVVRAGGPVGYDILPVHQPVRYMQKGWFDHEAHQEEDCSSCHEAKGSNRATDLLLPGIATCRECHGGEFAKVDVPSTCAMCHDYHADDGAPWLSKENDKEKRGKQTVDKSAIGRQRGSR